MFSGCYSLNSLELNTFNTSSVIDMSYMFSGYLSLKSLNLNNFNTSMVKYMEYMFANLNLLIS